MERIIIFTDIDGTIMDLTSFSLGPVVSTIPLVKKKNIPIILCSAKTRYEQEKIRKRLSLNDPFVVENGGGIYIPEGYFSFNIKKHIRTHIDPKIKIKCLERYIVLCIGEEYKTIIKILSHIREKKNLHFIGFWDLDIKKISQITGLTIDEAACAKQREFDETIVESREIKKLCMELAKYNLQCTHGGRFYHVTGKSVSKGYCVNIIKELYKKDSNGKILSIGIGDSENDISMLKSVDLPILVEKKGGGWIETEIPEVIKVKGIGPYGWREAIVNILEKYSTNH